MEIVERRNRSAPASLILVALFAALVLAAVLLGGQHRPAGSPAGAPQAAAPVNNGSPDAADRNSRIAADRLPDPEATHGH